MQNKPAESAFNAAMLTRALEKIDDLIVTEPGPDSNVGDNILQERMALPATAADAQSEVPAETRRRSGRPAKQR